MKLISILITRIFNKKKINGYISEVDKFLKNFNMENPNKSYSQKQEILRNKDIFNKKIKFDDNFLDN